MLIEQPAFQIPGHGGLARAGRARQPHDVTLVSEQESAVYRRERLADRRDVGTLRETMPIGSSIKLLGVLNDATARDVISVEDDEAAGGGNVGSDIEDEGPGGPEHHLAGLVLADAGLAVLHGQRDAADDARDTEDLGVPLQRRELQPVGATQRQRDVADPEYVGREEV